MRQALLVAVVVAVVVAGLETFVFHAVVTVFLMAAVAAVEERVQQIHLEALGDLGHLQDQLEQGLQLEAAGEELAVVLVAALVVVLEALEVLGVRQDQLVVLAVVVVDLTIIAVAVAVAVGKQRAALLRTLLGQQMEQDLGVLANVNLCYT
jgi:hypothetical protein